MESKLWRVGGKDVLRGAINAILISIVVGLAGIVSAPGFDVFNADFVGILRSMTNWGFISFITYVGAVFTSDHEGRVFGSL